MTKTKIARGYRYMDEGDEGGEDEEGIGSVVPICFPDTSSASASAANTTALVESVLSDTASRAKVGAGAGPRRRRTKKNITTGGRYSLRRLGLSLRIFVDSSGIGIVIGSDRQEGPEAMEEAELSI